MAKSTVYFTNLRTDPTNNLLDKLRNLVVKAGFLDIDLNRKMVAIKIHFGEPGNLAFIRPNFIAVMVKLIKENDGLPFLTDSNTLYKGKRSNAVQHLQSALENGFTPCVTGCNIIIADGIKGTQYREIVINQEHCKTAKIGAAIADSDVVISMNHFKGHEMAGFGGALKNLGMGSGSVGGKLEMHSDSKPVITVENCTGCGICEKNCAHDAVVLNADSIAEIDYQKCTGCGQCVAVCRYDGAQSIGNSPKMQEKMVEYALAVVKDKPAFHVNFLTNISPNCDCWNYNDTAIAPDLGIMASFDPVALDKASADMVNKAVSMHGSVLDGHAHDVEDKFTAIFPNIDWKVSLNYAEKIGLGNQEYQLVEV
jgi:uncharacterized protein